MEHLCSFRAVSVAAASGEAAGKTSAHPEWIAASTPNPNPMGWFSVTGTHTLSARARRSTSAVSAPFATSESTETPLLRVERVHTQWYIP